MNQMLFKKVIVLCITTLLVVNANVHAEEKLFDHTHNAWNEILKKELVTEGAKSKVKYAALKQDPKQLQGYTSTLSEVTKSQYEKFSESERLAFLINAYNAFTVRLIVDNYPVSSIEKIGNGSSTPWKIQFVKLFGEIYSLDDIEHEMIRKWFDEPRIHFALVCAAKSCPALRSEAYVASRLEAQLSAATRTFLTDKQSNYFDAASSTLYLSSIFKWYGDDFNNKHGSARIFVAPIIAGTKVEEKKIANEDTTIQYLNYDWALNDAHGD